jgi:hypothetical protein
LRFVALVIDHTQVDPFENSFVLNLSSTV